MGFRSAWLKHEGFLSVHTEDFLHAMDRVIPDYPLDLLLVGVANGGSVQVWKEVLLDGSSVTAIDSNPLISDLDLDVLVCDINDSKAMRKILLKSKFDVIIDSTGSFLPAIWPFLRVGGIFIVDHYQHDILLPLVSDISHDRDSFLPTEEVMAVSVFANVACIEKRDPRVVPYLEIITGTDDPLIDENFYLSRGAKRVVLSKQTTP